MKSKLFLGLSLLAAVSFVESATPAAADVAAEAAKVAATPAAKVAVEAVAPKAGMFARVGAKAGAAKAAVVAKLPACPAVVAKYAPKTVAAAVAAGLSYVAYEQYKAYNKPEVKPLTYAEQAKEAFNKAYASIKANPVKSATAAVVAAVVVAAVYNSCVDSEVSAA